MYQERGRRRINNTKDVFKSTRKTYSSIKWFKIYMFYTYCKCSYLTCVIMLNPGTVYYLTEIQVPGIIPELLVKGSPGKPQNNIEYCHYFCFPAWTWGQDPIAGDTLVTGLKEVILVLTWRPPTTEFALVVSEGVIQSGKEDKQSILLYIYKSRELKQQWDWWDIPHRTITVFISCG